MSTTLTAPVGPSYTGKLIAADKLSALESLASSQVNALAHPAKGEIFGPAFQRAEAVGLMRDMLTDEIMKPIMALQGSRLGFRTDKDRERNKDGGFGYPMTVVRDCMIEGILLGARPCGNEINIIAGNTYLTREYFLRVLREWPGLTDLVIKSCVPVIVGGEALVEVKATWKLDGRLDMIHCRKSEENDDRISIRVNNGMGTDAILGKADRKIGAKIWRRLTGSETTIEGDSDDADTPRNIPSRTLEIPPESPPGRPSTNGSPKPKPATEATPEHDPSGDTIAQQLMSRIERAEAAKSHTEMRRIKMALAKASSMKQITQEDEDFLQIQLQEAKNRLPAE